MMTTSNAQLNAKYESEISRLITEQNRIKLPNLVENTKYNPGYMTINSDWSSSWDEVTKSRLIESLLINIPVLPIVVFEREYSSYEVIDGRERIKTIVDFYSERLTLTGLEVETDLERFTYSALPAKIKDKLNNCSLSLINCIPAGISQSKIEVEKLIDVVKERYS